MELLDVYSEDIYSYKQLSMGFNFSGGVTLILGRDLKLKTANGVGKTTLIKIIYFLIYGEDLNESTKSSIPNRAGDGSFYGYIRFKENGHEFKIERMDKRKDKHPNKSSAACINFFIDDVLFMTTSEKKDSPTAIQQAILSKIKMSPRLFVSIIISKRSSNKNFLMANDTEKKEMLSEILDLVAYSKAFELVKKDISDIEKRRREKIIRLETFKKQISDYFEDIKEQESLSLNYSKEKEILIKGKKDILDQEKKKFVEIKSKVLKIEDVNQLNDQKNNISIKISELKSVLGDEIELSKEISRLESEINSLTKEKNLLIIKKIDEVLIKTFLNKKGFKKDLSFQTSNDLMLFLEKSLENQKELEQKVKDFVSIENSSELLKKLSLQINDLKNEISQYKKDILKTENDKTELENSETCPTCLRDYDNEHKKEHIQPKIDEKKTEINFLKKSLEESERLYLLKNKEYLDLDNSIKEYNKILEEYKEYESNNYILKLVSEDISIIENQNKDNQVKINDLMTSLKEKEEILLLKNKENLKFSSLKAELETSQKLCDSLESRIKDTTSQKKLNEQYSSEMKTIAKNGKRLEEEIINIQNSESPYHKIIESLKTKIKGIEEQVKTFEKSIADDDEELYYLKFWHIGFSPTGIRSFISDDLIDLLNQKVQDNLNDLYDGALSILFESESEDSKGVTVNKISTNCFLDGKEVEITTLSDGQLNRAVLATDLALMEVAESRSGTWLNVKFLDEPCANMDSAGQQQAFKLFNKLAKQKDGFFVISHDESFQSMCANIIHVVRDGSGISKIVSKEEFKKFSSNEIEDSNIFDINNKKEVKSSNILKEIVFKNKKKKEDDE